MKITRPLLLLASLLASLAVHSACKPSQGNGYDAGCNQQIAGTPDGSINPVCSWAGSCQSSALEAAINQAIGDAGVCAQDSDCAFVTDGGPFVYACVSVNSTNPVNLARNEPLLIQIEGMMCGYCNMCTSDAGSLISLGAPMLTPQAQLCMSCEQGQCSANPIVLDAGD